ncbi:MAG: radical SAM protein [Oryzomonas sp.]|jgi:hypothetical protein
MSLNTVTEVKNKETIKQRMLDEVKLSIELNDAGISYNPEELKPLRSSELIPYPFQGLRPGVAFTLPHGIKVSGGLNKWAPYAIVVENGKPVLYNEKEPLAEITFYEQPVHPVLEQQLSTGEKVKGILTIDPHGQIDVSYSAECSLKDNGEDCLFCSINVREREPERVLIKNSRQIAEAYDIVRQAGYGNNFKISGGFVPERREVEYYIDVVEAIREKYSKFKGVAVIGAPADLSILPKYKEAGYTDLSHNLEVWDKNLFAHICPGKSKRNGGWQHWVDSLVAAVDVFGKGQVHSNFVGGLDTMDGFLEGIEFLSSKGVVAHFGMFSQQKNTGLEGKRGPEPWYHWELVDKATDIQLRYGFTTEQMYRGPGTGDHNGRVLRIKRGDFVGDKMDIYQFPPLD